VIGVLGFGVNGACKGCRCMFFSVSIGCGVDPHVFEFFMQ
jgi:hypothetical protein